MARQSLDLESFALSAMLGRSQPKNISSAPPRGTCFPEDGNRDTPEAPVAEEWRAATAEAFGLPGAKWASAGNGAIVCSPSGTSACSDDVLLSLVYMGLGAVAAGGTRAVEAVEAHSAAAPLTAPPPAPTVPSESHIFSLKEWRAAREQRRREQDAWLQAQQQQPQPKVAPLLHRTRASSAGASARSIKSNESSHRVGHAAPAVLPDTGASTPLVSTPPAIIASVADVPLPPGPTARAALLARAIDEDAKGALDAAQRLVVSAAAAGPGQAAPSAVVGPGVLLPAATDAAVAAAASLSTNWGPEFDRLYSAVVLSLPRLIARAALTLPPVATGAAAASILAPCDDGTLDTALTASETASLAVGSALVSACEGLLTDAEVVTLLREAVAARVAALQQHQ